ncbi:response regulator [Actinoallomurus spadix]|uniref:response regulator n=1 Tax=Actinoallomurus spadix TaxID=79912 RepID=UPI00209288D2|nr:response regulator [Actinoallomurus spadix]MCO5988696.1 response regulator [Actinoallomurus spadix]
MLIRQDDEQAPAAPGPAEPAAGSGTRRRSVHILVVEDDPGDQMLIEEAFSESEGGPPPRLAIVEDGEEALDFLHRRGTHTGASRPDLVLLDLNLPKYSGRAVLEQIKTDTDLRSIPVVIFTTSASADDVAATYLLHANAYVTKPVDLDGFTTTVQRINSFFTRTARLPEPPVAA